MMLSVVQFNPTESVTLLNKTPQSQMFHQLNGGFKSGELLYKENEIKGVLNDFPKSKFLQDKMGQRKYSEPNFKSSNRRKVENIQNMTSTIREPVANLLYNRTHNVWPRKQLLTFSARTTVPVVMGFRSQIPEHANSNDPKQKRKDSTNFLMQNKVSSISGAPLSNQRAFEKQQSNAIVSNFRENAHYASLNPSNNADDYLHKQHDKQQLYHQQQTQQQQEELPAHQVLPEGADIPSDRFPFYLRLWASVAISLVLVVGFSGNLLVPVLVCLNKDLRHSTNLFLLNLAAADLLVLLVCLPTALVELHAPPDTWVMGHVMCEYISDILIIIQLIINYQVQLPVVVDVFLLILRIL